MAPRPVRRLEVASLTARAGSQDVLSDVTFDVATGEIIAIVGPNGAGKTALLECIAGLRPASGAVRFDCRELRTLADRARGDELHAGRARRHALLRAGARYGVDRACRPVVESDSEVLFDEFRIERL